MTGTSAMKGWYRFRELASADGTNMEELKKVWRPKSVIDETLQQ